MKIIIAMYILLGVVLDIKTKEPLVGVRVISDCDTVYTDFEGNFSIQSKDSMLTFDYISYTNKIILHTDTIFLENL